MKDISIRTKLFYSKKLSENGSVQKKWGNK